jgi:hypothetical protein
VEIATTSDLVHPYSGFTSGKYIYTAWQYIPSGMSGLTYFLIQNTYNHGGPYNWSVQTVFDSADGLVKGWYGSGTQIIGPAYKVDEWVKLTVFIDLDADWAQFYYGDYMFDDPSVADHPVYGGGYSWTLGIFGGGGGVLEIGAVDLFANGATAVYYDDLSIQRATWWGDDFEAYVNGTDLHGVEGWAGWDNDPQWTAFVTNAQARSGVNSIDCNGNSDLTHRYAGHTSGTSTYTAWQYIPTGYTGLSYFIMLNTYAHGGTKDWSVQFNFDSATGLIGGNFGGAAITLIPYVLDQWVPIEVVVYLDNDWVKIFYNGTELDDPAVADDPILGGGYQWTAGVFGGGTTGVLNIGAVDLFANGATTIYYDDISLTPMVPCLQSDVATISEATGGQANMTLNSGQENAFRNYLMIGGVTGIDPGTPLPKNGPIIPVHWDPFTNVVLGLLNTPAFANFLGVLDDSGFGMATFDTLAPIPGAAGFVMTYAYCSDKPYDFASNQVTVTIVP